MAWEARSGWKLSSVLLYRTNLKPAKWPGKPVRDGNRPVAFAWRPAGQGLNALGSPFGMETQLMMWHNATRRKAKWPGKPVRDGNWPTWSRPKELIWAKWPGKPVRDGNFCSLFRGYYYLPG